MTVAAVLLAAGGGSRFTASGGSGHKLLAPYLGRTVVEWSIESAAAAHLDATYVVRGAVELPLPSLAAGQVRFVRNDLWREGMATSLQAGITRARRDGHAAVVVGLGDQPLVQPEAWRRLARAAADSAGGRHLRGRPGQPGAAVVAGVAAAAPGGRRGRPAGHAAPPGPGDRGTVPWSVRRHRYGGRSRRVELSSEVITWS